MVVNELKSGHALSWQNMWQITTAPGGVQCSLAPKLNSTVQFGPSKLGSFFICCCSWNNSTDREHIIMMSRTWSAKSQKSGSSCIELGKQVHTETAKIYSVEKFVHWLIFVPFVTDQYAYISDFTAEHMLTPFSQISSDAKPVKSAGEGSKPNSIIKELPEVTFELISTANMNLIGLAWFHFLNFFFSWHAVSRLDHWKYVCINMTHRLDICVSKLKCNRPTFVLN